MTEEKALALYARCYNRCDFSELNRKLSQKATYMAYNNFYEHKGRGSVCKALDAKAADLRALPRPNKVWRGYLKGRAEALDLPRMDSCLVLTADDPSRVLGVVILTRALFRIRDIRVLDPARCQYTRGSRLECR